MFVRDPTTATIGNEILPFECMHLSEFFQEKAKVELHDSPEKRIEGIQQIKKLIENDKLMMNITFSEDFLLQYLKGGKHNVVKAFSQLKYFVKLKKKNPQMFCNFQFENTVKTMTDKILTVLPWRCQDGCAILLLQLDNWNPEEFPIEEVKRMVVVLLLQSLRYPMTQVNGFKVILDVKSNPLRHLRHVTPYNLYLLIHGTQECVAARYKSMHVINDSVTFKAFWAIAKHFLSDKLRKRFIFHSTSETLLDYFPRDVLPLQYGGSLENYDMSHWLKKMMQPEELAEMIGGNYNDNINLLG